VIITKYRPDPDLLEKSGSERTRLTLVTSKPVPFPPEPVRSAVVQLTRSSLARADRNEGRRDAWLRLLDRLGLGFDSRPLRLLAPSTRGKVAGLTPAGHGYHEYPRSI
jgi:hypothetical protein